jgi:arylsulfatase A-like enzyme
MIMSGTDAHLGGLGTLIEFKMKEPGSTRWHGKAGYEGYLNESVLAMPEVLKDNGYWTAMSGKVRARLCPVPPQLTMQWHLGLRPEQGPWARGFEKAFSQLPGCSNHWGWEPQQEPFGVGGRPVHAEMGEKVDV